MILPLKNKHAIVTFLLLALLSCTASNKSAEQVALQFVRQLYQLDYTQIETLATGDALLQAALLQGRLDESDEATQLAYRNLTVDITAVNKQANSAVVAFNVTAPDGSVTANSLTMQKIKGKWMVTTIEKSPLPTVKFFFS